MTEERITAYLLAELSEEELARFEDECFAQEEWPAEVNLVEEDLIDDYLRNLLTPEQRLHFEQNYLSTTARMERVKKAAALLRHIDEYVPAATAIAPTGHTWAGRLRAFVGSQTRTPRVAMALVAAVIVIASTAWLALYRDAPPPRSIATLTLSVSNSDRAESTQASRVALMRDNDALKISLRLPDPPAQTLSYRVQVEDDNSEIKSSEIAGQDAQAVSVMLPAAQLAPGQYAVQLFAVKAAGTEQRIGTYFFIVD